MGHNTHIGMLVLGIKGEQIRQNITVCEVCILIGKTQALCNFFLGKD